jgi:hypothetical protein
MTSRLLAVELNDAGIVLARAGASGQAEFVGQESPGLALLHDGRVLVGTEAAARYRSTPLHAQSRFWVALGLEPLPWSARGIATVADLAHAHLASLVAPAIARADVDGILIAVPPGYDREQLGLLVGIANECGAPVRGLVDLGLAACAPVNPAPHMVHLDLQLHQAAATLLEVSRTEGVLRRSRYELLPGAGLLSLRQAMAAAVATAFVHETRFDPLHQAATEQRLHDLLPAWVQSLAASDETEAAIELGATTHRITLLRSQLEQAVEAICNELLRLVQAARPAGTPIQLCVTPRIVAVPGLLAKLAALRDCVIVQLPAGAAAAGALQFAANIVRPADAISLVHRLPLAGPAVAVPTAAGGDSAPAVPAATVPTHVLFRGRAWPITEEPLTLGWSVGAAARALSLPAGIAGVSRSHCVLQSSDGQCYVVDHSTYGTFVNDERVGGRLALRVGDVLRLGAPGVTLELIRVLPEHGAA